MLLVMERSKFCTSQACADIVRTTIKTVRDMPARVGVEDPVQPHVRVSPVEHRGLHADQTGADTGRPLLHIAGLRVGHGGKEGGTVAFSFDSVDHTRVETVGHTVGEARALFC